MPADQRTDFTSRQRSQVGIRQISRSGRSIVVCTVAQTSDNLQRSIRVHLQSGYAAKNSTRRPQVYWLGFVGTPARRTALVGRAREGRFQARPHDVPLSAWTGTTVPRRSRHSSHRSCIATSATFRQPTPAHCASLSTQHIRSSGFSGCWSDGLELTAR